MPLLLALLAIFLALPVAAQDVTAPFGAGGGGGGGGTVIRTDCQNEIVPGRTLCYDSTESATYLNPTTSAISNGSGLEGPFAMAPDLAVVTQSVTACSALPACDTDGTQCLHLVVDGSGNTLDFCVAGDGEAFASVGGLAASGGYRFPADDTEGIAVGDDATPADKEVLIKVGAASEFEYGILTPADVPKWRSATFSCGGVAAWTASDTALNRGHSGAAADAFGNLTDLVKNGEPITSGRVLNFGTCTAIIHSVAGLTSTDSYPFKLWGCDLEATSFANCTSIATLFTLTAASVAGYPTCDLSAVAEIAANTYEVFMVGFDDADRVDTGNDGTATLNVSIDYIDGPVLP